MFLFLENMYLISITKRLKWGRSVYCFGQQHVLATDRSLGSGLLSLAPRGREWLLGSRVTDFAPPTRCADCSCLFNESTSQCALNYSASISRSMNSLLKIVDVEETFYNFEEHIEGKAHWNTDNDYGIGFIGVFLYIATRSTSTNC